MGFRVNPDPAPGLLAGIEFTRAQAIRALAQIASGRRVNALDFLQ